MEFIQYGGAQHIDDDDDRYYWVNFLNSARTTSGESSQFLSCQDCLLKHSHLVFQYH